MCRCMYVCMHECICVISRDIVIQIERRRSLLFSLETFSSKMIALNETNEITAVSLVRYTSKHYRPH